MSEFPDDVLIIHYAELALDPANRLRTLGAIGTLLNRLAGFYTPAALELSPNVWLCLRTWLEQGNAATFWRPESQGVRVIRLCEKHVLVGTGQLLVDLKKALCAPRRVRVPSFDAMWVAAQRYVTEEIARLTL